jgi:hypothetical protein
MRNTFKNNKLQKNLEENGYLIIPSFLNEIDIISLSSFYEENKETNLSGFHATMHSKDSNYRQKTNAIISSKFESKIANLLDNYRPVIGNFTVKEVGENSFFDFHLDWNMLDESKARSITIWVPLVDTNKTNGNLWVLKNSHKLDATYRAGPGLNLFTVNEPEYSEKHLEKIILPMHAGDAIIYDHKLFHASPPNLSNQRRLAINLALLPREMKSFHYFYENEKVNIYEVPDSFYCECLTHQEMDMTKFKRVDTVSTKINLINQKNVNELIKDAK